MAASTSLALPSRGAPQPSTTDVPVVRSVDSAATSPTAAFVGLMVLLLIEYLALGDDFPPLKAVRFTTILSYVLFWMALAGTSRDLPTRPQTQIALYFIVMSIASMMWAVITSEAFDSIRPLVDYLALMIGTAYVVDRRERVQWLAITVAFIGAVLVFRNLNALGDVTRSMHFKASYFMGDGNDFSWGLNMMLPLAVFLVFSKQPLVVRLGGAAASVMCLMGIIGTSSRGATIGLAAGALFAWLFVSTRRLLGGVLLALGVALVVALAPSGYFARMQSVTSYEEDNSAQIRLQAWTAAVQMAMDYPFGVGGRNFGSAYGRFYRPAEGTGRITYGANRWVAAHSIYFKVLGEYGLPGLFMLLLLIWVNLRMNQRSMRALRVEGRAPPIDPLWPGLLNMSLVATAVSGTFLGGFDYPHLFLISGLTMATKQITDNWLAGASRAGEGVVTSARSRPDALAPFVPQAPPAAPATRFTYFD